MSDKLKASLPGIFSIAFLVVFLLTQFISGLPFEVMDYVTVVLIGIAGILGIAWIPPALDAQHGDQTLKGNLGPIFTLAVLGLHVGDQLSTKILPVWPEMLGDALLLIATWLGLPWTKPQLPSQASMALLLFGAGVLIVAGPAGGLILLA